MASASSSAVAAVEPEEAACPSFLNRPLPSNQDNLCWFDSTNVALFHKKRSVFEELKGKTDWKPLYDIYNYFSCGTNPEGKTIRDLYNIFRTNEKMKTYFNDITEHANVENIVINKDTELGFLKRIKFNNMESKLEITEPINETIKFDKDIQLKIYDLTQIDNYYSFLYKETDTIFYLLKVKSSDIIKENGEKEKALHISDNNQYDANEYLAAFRKNTQEILKDSFFPISIIQQDKEAGSKPISLFIPIIDIMIQKLEDANLNSIIQNDMVIIPIEKIIGQNPKKILETITVESNTLSFKYSLDAIVMHTGGRHYISIVKEGNKWYIFNDSLLNENETLNEFINRVSNDKESNLKLKYEAIITDLASIPIIIEEKAKLGLPSDDWKKVLLDMTQDPEIKGTLELIFISDTNITQNNLNTYLTNLKDNTPEPNATDKPKYVFDTFKELEDAKILGYLSLLQNARILVYSRVEDYVEKEEE